MLGYQARAAKAGLAKLGEPSLLDGADVGKVQIEYGVETFVGDAGRADDNYPAHVDVATIDADYSPISGQVLEHPDGTFKLVSLVEDNGHLRSFTIVKTA